MKRKSIISILSILFTTSIAAQELVVFDSISLCSNCNIKNYRNELDTIDFETDLNGKKCALLLVHLDNLDVFNIEGVYKEEYWDDGLMLWMPDGSNWITIRSDYFTPLRLEFPPLVSGKIYTMSVGIPEEKNVLVLKEPLRSDLSIIDASRYSEKDSHGRNCALLQIGLVESNASFSSNNGKVVKAEYRGAEWWVWMEPGSTSLTITCPFCKPLYLGFERLQSSVTYITNINKYKIQKKYWAAVGFQFFHSTMSEEVMKNSDPTYWVLFEYGNIEIDNEQMEKIEAMSEKLEYMPDEWTCNIVGIWNIRSYGSDEYNIKITEKLAHNIKEIMVNKYHVSEKRLKVIGWGRSRIFPGVFPDN